MRSKIYNAALLKNSDFLEIGRLLKEGKIGILPTDTIYGIHTNPFQKKSVIKIFNIKKREQSKPFIIIIPSINDLKLFDIKLASKEIDLLKKIWPNPVSVILPTNSAKFNYLHQGKKTIAFRIPKSMILNKILNHSGPLISTSVNLQGQTPAKNIQDANLYFQNKVDFYIDAGELNNPPSVVVCQDNEKLKILRAGNFKIPKELMRE